LTEGSNDFYERGRLAYQLKNYKLAEKLFKDALSKSPDSVYSHAMLAVTLHAQNKFKPALREAKEAVRLDPGYAYSYYALSLAEESSGQPKKALKAIEEAIRLEPGGSYIYAQASTLQLTLENNQKAIELAERGLVSNAVHVPCLNSLAAALLAQNKVELADSVAARALALEPENYLSHIRKASAELRLGKNVEAFEHYREALRLRPSVEAARIGALTALRARNPIISILLRVFINRRGLRLALVVLFIAITNVHGMRYAAYILIFLLFFTTHLQLLALRLDPQGKQLLTKQERFQNNVFLALIAGFLLAISTAVFSRIFQR
jgi:tetratricopeptide (TPR) repeat protein